MTIIMSGNRSYTFVSGRRLVAFHAGGCVISARNIRATWYLVMSDARWCVVAARDAVAAPRSISSSILTI
eukprot:8540563-Pyramimonas_sp.AAC.1